MLVRIEEDTTRTTITFREVLLYHLDLQLISVIYTPFRPVLQEYALLVYTLKSWLELNTAVNLET